MNQPEQELSEICYSQESYSAISSEEYVDTSLVKPYSTVSFEKKKRENANKVKQIKEALEEKNVVVKKTRVPKVKIDTVALDANSK